ncbi:MULTISPECIES: aldehyde dehydrogenase family protein [unclassified Mesorhizobium]|uniref:aldehyde dehydrogenase family protein n=1 Tax=unclassified Mesorhizobium TaxID=325217 RepID=UPI000FCA8A53|nr:MULTISPECIES: aldehyde dehydrogenase family protein [unclassified Mesorhizobium]RUV98905.1 aldehyde dehydrogenase family protein [Mesorhizobium sp. M1A.F.Ca.IN.020.04.1.1]RUW14535.1 aldehyde dehydrogenase family protein [Mesorhizobium sp. M1A.F.Ca.IN.020.03.1.1]RWF70289.1 MAG: aldehyde dehydrogenase family protein [Mesorhizobium sp.]RWG11287.1 MAG: aldehyde dehydrogenase family protein [Mesorhizobium sp.]RWG26787.1 MAG: aldehyde dehydrogenase family protein [Mesorhizobium sp.]
MTAAKLRVADVFEQIAVRNPYDGTVVGSVESTAADQIAALINRAKTGAVLSRALPRHQRATLLERAASAVERQNEDFARLIVREAGKTIVQARKEASRCVNTLKLSAEEAKRNAGEVIPFDAYAGSEARQGWFTREPLGIIAAITPYNDPLNLVAHKLGPAIAGGNAVLLKPSELTPLSAIRLVETLVEAGLPEEIVTVAVGGADLGSAIVSARDVRMVSFTGGFATGEAIARTAGLKKLAMDLGGNAPVVVLADCDFAKAVDACVSGAYWAAGQNCIGTQRIIIQAPVYERFREAFVAGTRNLLAGNPEREDTDVGPMISEQAAKRAETMVDDAIAAGAKLLCGHRRAGTVYQPTVLEGVPKTCRLWAEEVFAPVVLLQSFDTLADAIVMANGPEYSLHAGVFTNNIGDALDAAGQIEAGGVMINDSSDYRFDAMPFGGFKYGAMGREGVRFAYEEMTQPKVICINRA